ncbi:MAG: amidohydrolase family protein [Anaerolineae bacterium]|jgi:predicted TIM-barrel fold metal-dependent hydrolase
MLIIDFHTHITAPEIIDRRDEYLVRDAWFRDLYANPKARLSSAEDLLAAMDRDSVEQAVVFGFGWRDMEMCRRDNDYVIESVSRYPDRLIGFAIVNPQCGSEAVREIERCAAAGLVGIGELMPDGQGYRLDDQKIMAPIVEVAMEHDMVLLTHSSEPVGHLYPGKGTVTPDEIIRFARLFPDAKLVCAHWGGGTIFYELMPEVSRIMCNVYYDTAASLFLYQDDIFTLAARWAPGKVLFATDFPLIGPGTFIRRLEAARMPTATRRRMLGGNAWRILKLGERSEPQVKQMPKEARA